MLRRPVPAALLVLLPLLALGAGEPPPGALAELKLARDEATVGDHLETTIQVELPAETLLERPRIGPELGKFTVLSGGWSEPVIEGDVSRWTWTGVLSVFELGEHEVPPVEIAVGEGEAAYVLKTEAAPVRIVSVLDPSEAAAPAEGPPEIADLKPPASIAPDLTPLLLALGIVSGLLLVSAVLWLVHRRYASRLAAVEAPNDPFHRTPPHVWVYSELQRLLERRLPEQGQIDLFYSEVALILKRYLGGRYRLNLLEHTTDEVQPMLRQAGAPEDSISVTRRVLESCDLVKFAAERPESAEWREIVDRVYRVVDETKPAESVETASQRGAA